MLHAPHRLTISMASTDPEQLDSSDPAVPMVDVYWRPGCGFCAWLLRSLEKDGVPVRRINIWEDDVAAAFVRAHANGNETVPTVDIAGTVLVNPPARDVILLAVDAGIHTRA
jgi:glutaredoxin-like protein